jgi:deoxycytidylate deaminase
MLINAGIEKVFYLEGYPDDLSMKMIDESSIIIGKVNFQRPERGGAPVKTLRNVPPQNSGVKRKEQKGPRKA